MWVVPVKGDVIKTSDDAEFTVASYSNFKTKGPCVYVEHDAGDVSVPIYFFDIKELNGVKVDYNNTSKVLNALGMIKRKEHLPQKHDYIFITETSDEEEQPIEKKVRVEELKLHNRNMGLSRGLLVIDSDGEHYSLKSINKIKRFSGDSLFDKSKFQKIYSDYLGYNGRK